MVAPQHDRAVELALGSDPHRRFQLTDKSSYII
jgi:hypothetical protein